MRKVWFGLTLLVAGVVAGCGLISPSATSLVGKPAPEVSGNTLDGYQRSLADYRGKVVMVDFWMRF